MPRQEAWGTVLDHTEPVPGGRDSRERSPGGEAPTEGLRVLLGEGQQGLSLPNGIGALCGSGSAIGLWLGSWSTL